MTRADLVAWLLTYAVHSTLLLGGVWFLIRRRALRSHQLQDTFWKAALIGGLVTATVQMSFAIRPAGSIALDRAAVVTLPTTSAGIAVGDAPAPASSAADLPLTIPTTASPATSAAVAPQRAPADLPTQPAGSAPASFALAAWGLLALLAVAHLATAHIRLSRRLGRRAPVADPSLMAQLDLLRRAAGVRRAVRLTSAEGLASPVALGRSEICLPPAVITDLDAAQQHSVLAHELAHLARLDPLWLALGCVIERVFFFQPLNRIARRRMQETAEYLCDDWAVDRTGSGLTMARSLVKVAEWMHGIREQPVPLSGMAETPSHLVTRVRRLIENREPAAPLAGAGRVRACRRHGCGGARRERGAAAGARCRAGPGRHRRDPGAPSAQSAGGVRGCATSACAGDRTDANARSGGT